LTVEVNGQTLVNLNNYNTLFHALLYMSATDDYIRQRLVTTGDGSATVIANAATLDRDYVIDTWLGFLGTAKPQFIDTSLLGNVRITLTLAQGPDVVMGTANSVAARTYTISDQYFSCDVVSISDGIYDSMIDQRLASGAPIEVPFKNYFSFTSTPATMAQQFNFHVASQSIDRLWAVPRASSYNAAGANGGATLAVATAGPAHPIITLDQPSFRFASCGGQDFQWQINNTLYPNWTSRKAQDWFQHTKLALGDQGNMLSGSYPMGHQNYTDHFFVLAQSLEHRTDGDERFMSGVDTRGAAASCYFRSTAGHAAAALQGGDHVFQVVFAECTSSLKIHPNKVLEIIQ